jgi:hypothetical protein
MTNFLLGADSSKQGFAHKNILKIKAFKLLVFFFKMRNSAPASASIDAHSHFY